MRSISRLFLLVIALCLSAVPTFSQAASAASIDARVGAEIASFKGKVFVYAKNFETGKTYSFAGDERVKTASTIKIAVISRHLRASLKAAPNGLMNWC